MWGTVMVPQTTKLVLVVLQATSPHKRQLLAEEQSISAPAVFAVAVCVLLLELYVVFLHWYV